jgi:hypothetical protein
LLKLKNEANFPGVKLASQPVRRRRAAPAPGAWSIVPVDGTAIRRKARRDYERVLRDLDAAKAEAERFEVEDKPQFAKWLSANFGALLTEIRELQEKLFQAQELVNEVQQEFYFGNYRSINKAYKDVMHRRNHPEEAAQKESEEDKEDEEFRREFEEAFNQMEDESAEEERAKSGRGRAARNGAGEAPGKQNNRVKDVYRKLVRLLHPDKGSKRTAKEVEWWHETQEAYETGNLEQLELILTLVEMEHKGSKEASISVLGQLTVEFRKSLKALKRKIASLKKEIAWGFSQLTDLSALMARTRAQLTADRDKLAWLLQKYQSQISAWEIAATTPGKRVRARRGAWQDEEWF